MLSTSTMNTSKSSNLAPDKKIRWHHIQYSLIGALSSAMWGWASAEPAQAFFFSKFSTAGALAMNNFASTVSGGNGTTVQTVFTMLAALITFVPWIVLISCGGIVIWQAYEGYQEYQRENTAGVTAAAMKVTVLFILVAIADMISAALVA